MTYETIQDLPDSIRKDLGLQEDVLVVYKEAFNEAWEQHKDIESNEQRSEMAHQIAWDAAQEKLQMYEK